jgi:glycosyltransferase involved in cell wall biosynthesis
MKICYFNGGKHVPSARFRRPFFEHLERRRHQCTMLDSSPSRYEHYPWLGWKYSDRYRRLVRHWHLSRVEHEDFATVVLETGILNSDDYSLERDLREVAGRLVYDIDDAVFLLFPEKTEAIATMADRVIAGNQRIADWALKFNQCVSIIPTCVDAEVYRPKNYQANPDAKVPIVGWIGSRGNVRMLSVCAPALRQLAGQRNFEFRVITSDRQAIAEIDLAGVNVKWINVNRCNTVAELQRFDIGITPLPDDDPWMEYKCNAKMIQYMSIGLPAVGSAVGFNHTLVDHGVNSLLAANHDEWVQCLDQLLDSAALRKQMGQAARASMLANYTVQSRIVDYERAILGAKYNPERGEWQRPNAG